MDWYQDRLFLLPENMGGFLFSISKGEILNAIKGDKEFPITPKKTRFKTPDYSNLIKGFDGFEAIAFNGNKIYITIEAEHEGEMVSYLVWGKIDSKSLEVVINDKDLQTIKTPIQLNNISFESLLINDEDIIMIYEANGSNLRKNPTQTVFSHKSKNIMKLFFICISLRIGYFFKIFFIHLLNYLISFFSLILTNLGLPKPLLLNFLPRKICGLSFRKIQTKFSGKPRDARQNFGI